MVLGVLGEHLLQARGALQTMAVVSLFTDDDGGGGDEIYWKEGEKDLGDMFPGIASLLKKPVSDEVADRILEEASARC